MSRSFLGRRLGPEGIGLGPRVCGGELHHGPRQKYGRLVLWKTCASPLWVILDRDAATSIPRRVGCVRQSGSKFRILASVTTGRGGLKGARANIPAEKQSQRSDMLQPVSLPRSQSDRAVLQIGSSNVVG